MCGPRWGGQHVSLPMSRAHSTVSRRYGPSLRLLESANCANTPATLHLTTGVAHTNAILGAIGVFYISLSTPITSLDIVRCASPCSLRRDKGHTRTHQELTDSDLYDGPGVPPWELVLVLSWCGTWCWYFLGLGFGFGIWWKLGARGEGLCHARDPAPWT